MPRQLTEKLTVLTNGLSTKMAVVASTKVAVVTSTKVAVDNLLIHRPSPQCALASQGTFTTMPVRPLTGGGLCRNVVPRPSNSMSAARYWLCTSRTVCRNTALNLSMRS